MEIPSKIQKEIKDFCKTNNIEDIDKFLLKILRDGFNIAKYGNGPTNIVIQPKKEEIIIEPISLEIPKNIEEMIENNAKLSDKVLDLIKVPKEVIENKKRNLYDED